MSLYSPLKMIPDVYVTPAMEMVNLFEMFYTHVLSVKSIFTSNIGKHVFRYYATVRVLKADTPASVMDLCLSRGCP